MADSDATAIFEIPSEISSAAVRPKRPFLVAGGGSEAGRCWPVAGRMVIGRAAEADVRCEAAGVSRRHAQVVLQGHAVHLTDLGSSNGTFVNGARVQLAELAEGDTVQVGEATLLRLAFFDDVELRHQEQLRDSAVRDVLTGAYNRRYFAERLTAELAYARRHDATLGLLLLDIDHFKRVNDEHGHPAGDAVLAAIGALLQTLIRTEDVLARYGGEEFAVILRATPLAGSRLLAERLRAATAACPISHGGVPLHVTISVGVAIGPSPTSEDAGTLVARADGALYAAKRAGRNRVEIAT